MPMVRESSAAYRLSTEIGGVEFVHKLLDVQVVVRVRVIQEDVVAGIKVVNRERSFSFKHRAK